VSTLHQLNQKIFPAALEEFCIKASLLAGLREKDAQLTAEVLVTTDTWGIHTHGVKQLRMLLRNFRDKRLDIDAKPELIIESLSSGLIDGHYSMPIVSSCMAMEIAIEKASNSGIAFIGVTHSGHFGAAGYYANMAAEKDMIGLAMCNVEPYMTVPGAKGKVLGTNPIAYAIPAGKERTILLDIATSEVAVSKVFAAEAKSQKIPDNWLVDAQGKSTNDPSMLKEGALSPMAGHKGYGIAVLIETLSSVLTGAAMLSAVQSWVLDLPGPPNQGHAFIAINPASIQPIEKFKERVDAMIQEIKSSPKRSSAKRIYLPGEMEWEKRDGALREGMMLPDDVVSSLRGLADDLGIE
jgi:ureidoglycolate dehydrogenase (NAD+)